MKTNKIWLLIIFVALLVTFFGLNLDQYLSLDYFSQQKENIFNYRAQHPVLTASIYFGIYVIVTALSLPAAAVITLMGGAIFGLIEGAILVSFASTIGATIAFLIARTLLRDSVEKRFANTFKTINKGVEKEGGFYLFGLRLVPLFPFVAVNLLMGLTSIKTSRYFIVSQLGMLPGTLVFVNAGTQLAQVDTISDVASPALFFSFALLGIFPLLAKKLLALMQARRIYQQFDKPKSFDANMVVIGAGSAGLVTSYIAAATKAKVVLIEKHLMGGDCLNTGCVPSKALIRSAKMMSYYQRAPEFGLSVKGITVDFPAVMERIQKVIAEIEPHDSIERYTALGVDCLQGSATILDPYRVEVNGKIITTQNIVIGTGARPALPEIDGIDTMPFYTSDTIWSLREKPNKMLVIGSGPIGCELAQSFHRLGIHVTLLNRSDRIMPKEDSEISRYVKDKLISDGLDLKLGYRPIQFSHHNGQAQLLASKENKSITINFDCLLIATGRQANVTGFGLDKLGVELNTNGTISVNEYLQTKYPNIYACGDVAGPYQFTHAAAHQAWFVAVNALFGSLKKFKADYKVIPWATFTDPEVARVGLNEQEAKAQNIDYEITRYGIDDLDRAIADGENHGEVKILTQTGKDKILGVTIVGHHAGDLITEYVTAMKHNLGLNKILGTIHIYPTLAESNKYAAGEWKRAHLPKLVMKWLPKWHRWKRKT